MLVLLEQLESLLGAGGSEDAKLFFESAGDRWWPIAGGVYFLRATKRVLGMRVITPAWTRRVRKKALASAARQARQYADVVE